MNRLPSYVLSLSNDDLILNRLKERGHRFRRSLGVSVFGCFEFAVLVNRLRTADPSKVARCLRLIESVATALRQTDDGDCVRCLVKLWLFAARIAGEAFPGRSDRYLTLAKSLVPPRPVLWSFTVLCEGGRVHQLCGRRRGNTCLTIRGSCSKWSARVAHVPS